jgi:hypothetical protein
VHFDIDEIVIRPVAQAGLLVGGEEDLTLSLLRDLGQQAGRTGLSDRHSTARVAVVSAAGLTPQPVAADEIAGDPPRTINRSEVPRCEIAKEAQSGRRPRAWRFLSCAHGAIVSKN